MDFDFNLHSFCLPPSQYFPFAQLATLFKVLQNASRCGRQRSLISGRIYAAVAGKVAKFQFRLLLLRLLRLLLSLPQNANDYKIARKLPVNVQHLWPRREDVVDAAAARSGSGALSGCFNCISGEIVRTAPRYIYCIYTIVCPAITGETIMALVLITC